MKRIEIVLLLCLALAAPASRACGPNFPVDLLGDRAGTLANLPEGSFAFEVRRIVSPPPAWTVVERAEWIYPEPKITRESIEREWWGGRYERIDGLRSAASAVAAYGQGEGLPEEARRYLAGAVAWANNDADDAVTRFQSVLALPADQRTHYGVWAQYMLGRVAVLQDDRDAALAAFAATRDLVRHGSDDPLGLAASSLGDEAKLQLDAGEDAAAIALYAEQAATGSEFGRTSLLAVARQLVRDDTRLDRSLGEPVVQRLMTAYLLTRSGELGESPYDADVDPHAAATPPIDAAAKIAHFLDAVERGGLEQVAGADRLAALAYRSGRYDLAQRLAGKDSSGLAWWLRAKLALRAGDVVAATQAYAQAARAFPADETWGTQQQNAISYLDVTRPQCRVEGEQGTLALARGEYVAAMGYLYNAASAYWTDAAWVAERVLTLDELKAFVDTHVSAVPAKPPQTANGDEEESGWNRTQPAVSLRALLGRRLLRAERFDEALRYFDDAGLEAKAQQYVAARRAARRGDRIERAQALFDAARSARGDGLELLGYELDPDYQIWGGSFAYGYADEAGDASPSPFSIPLVGSEETKRTAASAAVPAQRFHYRYIAAGLAANAADLLPPRSQAFASVLCHATAWLLYRDPDAAQNLYRRYLRQGAYVAWGDAFGQECPAPDFPGAATRWHAQRVIHFKHAVRRALPLTAIIGVPLLSIAALVAFRRRKHAGA